MIPRYQRILFWCLANAILIMALILLHGCQQAREKLTRQRDDTPLAAPIATPSELIDFTFANDADSSLATSERAVALPTESTARARALLTRLLAEYSVKGSTHPLESGPAVDDVFLLELPVRAPSEPGKPAPPEDKKAILREDLDTWNASPNAPFNPEADPKQPGGQLAVVNLRKSFADDHPSGIEAETLTIESIIGTLHANFPKIEAVRFLVDGQPRDTLNGHADLMRTYRCVDTAAKPDIDPLNQEGR